MSDNIVTFPIIPRPQPTVIPLPSRASRLIEGLSALGAFSTNTANVRAAVMTRQTATLQQWVQDSIDGVDAAFAEDQLRAALKALETRPR